MFLNLSLGNKLFHKRLGEVTVISLGEDGIHADTGARGVLEFKFYDFGKVLYYEESHSKKSFDTHDKYEKYCEEEIKANIELEASQKREHEKIKLREESIKKEREDLLQLEIEQEKKRQQLKEERLRLKLVKRQNEIENGFSKYNISCLWHITHKDNIMDILKYGILNHSEALTKRDISNMHVQARRKKKEPCYNREIQRYAPLYIKPRNPMLYVLRGQQNDLCLLEVHLSALIYNEFVITDGNAASAVTKFYSSINNLDALSWDVLNAHHWDNLPDGKRKRCAEVLIYPRVQPKSIFKIHCFSDQTSKFLSGCGRDVSLTKNLFF